VRENVQPFSPRPKMAQGMVDFQDDLQ